MLDGRQSGTKHTKTEIEDFLPQVLHTHKLSQFGCVKGIA
jgi:hypothetical protein